MLNLDNVYVTLHARERLRERHPNVGVRGALALLGRSTEVTGPEIAPLLGRQLSAVRDRYFLGDDRRGVFVVLGTDKLRNGDRQWILVTFIRFGEQQETVAKRLWP